MGLFLDPLLRVSSLLKVCPPHPVTILNFFFMVFLSVLNCMDLCSICVLGTRVEDWLR